MFDKIVHTVVKAIEEDNPAVAQFVTLDAETADGLNIHKVSIPIPEGTDNRETVVKFIGENLDIVVAVGKDNVYVAAGREPRAKLKAAVAASNEAGAKTVPPVRASYAFQPIAARSPRWASRRSGPRPKWPLPN